MKSIVYIVPYFGKLKADFVLWVESCRHNPTINWILYTDDKQNEVLKYSDFPKNIKVEFMTFDEMRKKIQLHFEFKVELPAPYKLCDYRPAYGEIFADEIKHYDFWGHCDTDLIFGNIRDFLTEDILDTFERVGRWGHSIIYRNTLKNNCRYRSTIEGIINYQEVFQDYKNRIFDESGMLRIYDALGIRTYTTVKIADLHPSWWNFEIFSDNPIVRMQNNHRIFAWEDGVLTSYSLYDENICKDEFMYIHFLRRPMKLIHCNLRINKLLIIPNEISNVEVINIEKEFIIRVSKNRMDKYWISLIRRKWRHATPQKVFKYFKGRARGLYRRLFQNGQ